jgi:hypothetical protein
MSVTFYCAKLHLSKCDGLRAVSVKQNMNFNVQPTATFVLLVFHKKVLFKVVHSLKTYQHTKDFMVSCFLVKNFALHKSERMFFLNS